MTTFWLLKVLQRKAKELNGTVRIQYCFFARAVQFILRIFLCSSACPNGHPYFIDNVGMLNITFGLLLRKFVLHSAVVRWSLRKASVLSVELQLEVTNQRALLEPGGEMLSIRMWSGSNHVNCTVTVSQKRATFLNHPLPAQSTLCLNENCLPLAVHWFECWWMPH